MTAEFRSRKDLLCREDVWPLLEQAGLDSFAALMAFDDGDRVCHKRGRSVVRFEINGRSFFLKRNRFHTTEFWKRISRGRWPVRSALQEWENIVAVDAAGIATVPPVAFAEQLRCGVEWQSLTITEELYGARPLDTLVTGELAPGEAERHRRLRPLIEGVAQLMRQLHDAGMNHQDFYLNHVFVDDREQLYLIDLQRVQRRTRISEHSRVKDLAQLCYSALYYGGISRADRVRFMRAYLGCDRLDRKARRLWEQVAKKTGRIARHDVKLMARRRARGELPPA